MLYEDEDPSPDELEVVGQEMQRLWTQFAQQSRESQIPQTRSYFGAQATAIIHLALAIQCKIPDFRDYVREFRDKGLLR